MEEAEGALERRQEIVQRKHEELTGMSMKQVSRFDVTKIICNTRSCTLQ